MMKTVLITAPSSGSGKTTITMGILRAIRNKGLDVCAFKTGPDYIDRAFLEKACKGRVGNLDIHLQGKEGMLSALGFSSSEYCVVEGAMGYFDGMHNTYVNSSYDISRELGISSVLVYTPEAELFSAVPKIKGMAEFGASSIKAVLFNNVSEGYYQLLKDALEKHTDIKVLGYLPRLNSVELKSRHLGLVQSIEVEDMEERLEELAKGVEATIDLEAIIGMMKDIPAGDTPDIGKYDIKVAIAMDKAFSFYYTENLDILEKSCEVVYFSPLEDESLPKCDLLYLGGGYPEVFKEQLAGNSAMLASIREFSRSGGHVYSECGGFMYLTGSIDGAEMAGVFPGESRMTESLQNFGYEDIILKKDCMLGSKGDIITAQEFHRSVSEIEGETIFEISKSMGSGTWEGGYIYKNTYGGYSHINFLGNMKVLKSILDSIERSRKNEAL